MRMGQGVRTGLGHGGITCVLQTQFSSLIFFLYQIFIEVWIVFIWSVYIDLSYCLPCMSISNVI